VKALLIGAAPWGLRELRAAARAAGRAELRVAVDGGLDAWLQLGERPDLVVGDGDSLRARGRRAWRALPALRLPREKDRSDLYHALRVAVMAGARELECVGVTGGRPDHHLASLLELADFAAEYGVRVSARGPEGSYHFVAARAPWRQRLRRGQLVSIFALGGPARGVRSSGLRYALPGALRPGSWGLSNAALGGACELRLRAGRLLALIPS
jgi:thiamine pyrophosphokinase